MSEDLKHIERVSGLIIKYHREGLTDAEYQVLKEWSELSPENLDLFKKLSDTDYVKDKMKELPDMRAMKEAGWEKVMSVIISENPSVTMTPVRQIKGINYLVAASLLGVLTAGTWLYVKHRSVDKMNIQMVASTLKNDVAPGGNKATLTLSNGQQILLDDAKAGTLTEQGATQVIKKDSGTLSYATLLNEEPKKEELSYNTLTTPRAGTFLVELPDHSKVWLNNESSLHYPTHFDGQDTRTVELTGEAFFDISKDATHPFKVKVGNRLIEVLGSTFNVQAYTDEQSMQTTLISGAVKVNAIGWASDQRQNAQQWQQKVILKPGQQAQIENSVTTTHAIYQSPVVGLKIRQSRIKILDNVNIDGVVAWKNGHFHFEDAPIQVVMRQLARWYNIEVSYNGPLSNQDHLISGDIQRNLNLSQVAEILGDLVHFTIEGNKITVKL